MSVVPTCPHGKAMVRKRDLRTERGWQALDPLIRAQTGIVSWSGSRRDGDPTRCCFCHNSSFTPLNSPRHPTRESLESAVTWPNGSTPTSADVDANLLRLGGRGLPREAGDALVEGG